MLCCDRVGCIARKDRMPYATCLNLKRRVYAVVTDVMTEDGRTRYEYEMWYDYGHT